MNKTVFFTLLLCPLSIIRSPTEKHMQVAVTPQQLPTSPTAKFDSIPKFPNPEMVLVEGGSFKFGLIRDEAGQGFGSTDRTRQITVSSFMIGKYEVTQAEWSS